MFEVFRKLDLGEARSWEQYHILIVILPLANTKGSRQEVGRDVTLAGDMLKFEIEFRQFLHPASLFPV